LRKLVSATRSVYATRPCSRCGQAPSDADARPRVLWVIAAPAEEGAMGQAHARCGPAAEIRGHYPARAGPPCRHPAPGKCIARPPRVGPEVFSPIQDEITRPSVSRGGYRHCLCDSGGVGRPMRQHRHELRVPRPRRILFGRYEWASRSRCRPKILTRSATGWPRRSLRLRSTTS
jgi:hypothetical protein